MVKQMIKDLVPDQIIGSNFLVINGRAGTSKKGPAFWCDLTDKSGTIKAVRWDYDVLSNIQSGKVYYISGKVDEYQGKPQIKISSFRGPLIVDDMSPYVYSSKYPVPKMWKTITDSIESIKDDTVRSVATQILCGEYEERFKTATAAHSIHHAYASGLLEHTSEMCSMVDIMMNLGFLKENLSRDLCMFGVLVHDIGKIFEYTGNKENDALGILVPHIPTSGAIVYEACNKLGVPDDIRAYLMHVVLAHHGKKDWGSPVDMAIPEAAFVYFMDEISSKVSGWSQHIAESKDAYFWFKDRNIVTTRFDDVLKRHKEKKDDESI